MRVAADVGEVVSLGPAPGGERRVVAITGGTFTGKELSGEVLSGGADWQVKWEDGTLSIDAHYTLRERSGADRGAQYFRTAMRFTTGDARLAWLNRMLAVATAARRPRRVELDVYRVL